jgi:hypothetical protein
MFATNVWMLTRRLLLLRWESFDRYAQWLLLMVM